MFNNAEPTREHLKSLFYYLDTLVAQEYYEEIDSYLRENVILPNPASLIIGLLRFTYPIRHKLYYWESCLIDGINILTVRGLDGEDLLGDMKGSE